MKLEFRKAERHSIPMLLSIAGVSGSGKTYSALLLAAGIAGKDGRVGLIDTENGRGQMYADSPGIMRAYPNGYEYLRLDPPFSPQAYTDALKAAESAGITVCIVDSGSHEWEGIGGCTDIAESKPIKGEPNWKIAKRPHKQFVYYLLSSPMHIIVCLRAREKVAYLKNPDKGNKVEVVPMGIQAIAEKNFQFEALVSMLVDEKTHCATPIKVPEPLLPLFQGTTLVDKAMGERIRQWNDTGAVQPDNEQLGKRAKAEAENGVAAYREWFIALSKDEQLWLKSNGHEDNKFIAEQVDLAATQADGDDV